MQSASEANKVYKRLHSRDYSCIPAFLIIGPANMIDRLAAISISNNLREINAQEYRRTNTCRVVDDDQAIRWRLREALQSWGFAATGGGLSCGGSSSIQSRFA